MTQYLVVQVEKRRCYIASPGLSLVGFFPLLDIYVDRADRKHVTISVTAASAGLQGCPPSTTTFKRHVHHPPPPPYCPPFPRLINSNTHPFMRRDVLGIKGWKYIMDCRGPWTTTGRGGNGTFEHKRAKDHARGNGAGLATSQRARPIDRFQMAGGRPTRLLVCRAEDRQLPLQEYTIPPRQAGGSV